MKKLVKKNQAGDVLNAATYAIPIYGTYKTIKDAYKEPTPFNLGMAALSTVGDALSAFGLGHGINAAVASGKAINTANKVIPKIVKVVKESKPVWLTPEYSKMAIVATSPTTVGSKLGVAVSEALNKKATPKHYEGGNLIKRIVSFPSDLFHGRINFSEEDEVTKTPFGNVRKKTVIDKDNNMYEETIVEPTTGIAPAAEKLLHGLNGNIYRLLPNGKVQLVLERNYTPIFKVNTVNALREKAYRALKNKPFSEDRFPSYTRLKTR